MAKKNSDPFPQHIVPMLATSGTLPPDEEKWVFEIKWDGVRAVTYLQHGRLHMESRNLKDITPRYPEVHGIARHLADHDVVLDGEVVAFDDTGKPSFGVLQTRMHVVGERDVANRVGITPVTYFVFDVLHLDGRDLFELPWTDRRAVLEALRIDGPRWKTPAAHIGMGTPLRQVSRDQGLEGIVAKRLTSTYTPGRRSKEWLKVKNIARQEVVIGGWLPGSGNRTGRIGALLVGYHDDTGLRFAGKVGTGFTDKELTRLGQIFSSRGRPDSPFVDKVPYREARYLTPELVCDVEFTEWTHTGTLRHPSYKGLRDDKAAGEVVREPTPH